MSLNLTSMPTFVQDKEPKNMYKCVARPRGEIGKENCRESNVAFGSPSPEGEIFLVEYSKYVGIFPELTSGFTNSHARKCKCKCNYRRETHRGTNHLIHDQGTHAAECLRVAWAHNNPEPEHLCSSLATIPTRYYYERLVPLITSRLTRLACEQSL